MACLQRWAKRYPRLTDWVEAHIGETLNFCRLPRQNHKLLNSTDLLRRHNEEIKRRTRVVRIFPNPASCLRLIHPKQKRLAVRERNESASVTVHALRIEDALMRANADRGTIYIGFKDLDSGHVFTLAK